MKKIWIKLISVFLVLATLFTALPLTVFAAENGPAASTGNEVYIKEVKLAEANTGDEAKKILESEGFIFLNSNLNEGTGSKGVWLGYKTTTDPTEAIYDIKLMNTKGGYTLTSMDAVLESQKSTFTQMAKDLNYLIEEFAKAYKANNVAAQKAYMALNFYRMVDGETELEEKNGLGYHLVNGKMTIDKLTELILFCDATILDGIVKLLTMGIQLGDENWMEELSAIGPYDSEKIYAEDETELKRRANQLLVVLKLYAQTYNSMNAMGLFSEKKAEGDDNSTAEQKEMAGFDIARVDMYKIVFEELAKYPYGNGTLKDFIASLENTTNEKALYPLVSVLSDGEFSSLSYGCFMEMVAGTVAEKSSFDNYDLVYADLTKDVKSFYLYKGINSILLEDDTVIAFTDDASRRMALTGEYQFYEKENFGEDFWENGRYFALGIQCAGFIAMMGSKAVLTGMSLLGYLAAATAKGATGILAGVAKVCTFIGGPTFQLIVFVATLVVALISYAVYCIYESWNNKVDWSENPIPEYIYDVKEVSFASSSSGGIETEYMQKTAYMFYEVVTDVRNKPADLNAHSSDESQWIAMYVSYDRPGDDSKPIKADGFKVKTGNGEDLEGYTPVSRFGEVRAYNLNQWDDRDDVNGIYMFFQQDKNVNVKSDRQYYIADVLLQTGESDAHCISLLEAADYIPLNINLSPDHEIEKFLSSQKVYTYLGYKLTDNPQEAITDIRVEYGVGVATRQYGSVTYAASGTSAGVTLYATKYKEAGTPILAGSLICVNDRDAAPEGYEPVNFFAGGPAASFNLPKEGIYIDTTEFFLYFLPSTSFTSGEVYLGGLGYYYSNEFAMKEWWDYKNYRDAVSKYLKDKTGDEHTLTKKEEAIQVMNDYAFLKSGYSFSTSTESLYSDSIVYYYTHNPYRAIYSIKGTSVNETPKAFSFDGVGYSQWNYIWWSGVQYESSESIREEFTFRYNNQGAASLLALEGNFYVAGNPTKGNTYDKDTKKMTLAQPLRFSDIVTLTKGDDMSAVTGENSPYNAVVDLFGTTKDPLAVKESNSNKAFVMYTTNKEKEKPYISSITAIDTLTLFRALGGHDAGIKRGQITTGMLLAQLAGQGATHFVDFPVSIRGFDLKFGYTRTDDEDKALRDIFIYFGGFTTDAPPSEIYRGNVKYTVVCEIPYNLTGFDGAPRPSTYIYGTTDTRAGEPIVDFQLSKTPFADGYVAARTQNGRSLWAEMTEYFDKHKTDFFDRWALIQKGAYYTFETLLDCFNINRYISVEMGDTSSHVASQYESFYKRFYYILTKQEDYDLREEKPYITELYFPTKDLHLNTAYDYVHLRVRDNLFDQGADEIVPVNIYNSYYNASYLGYKRTEDPNEAITSIRVMYGGYGSKIINMPGVTYQLVSELDVTYGVAEKEKRFYFYYTKSQNPDIGSPISDIIFTLNSVPSYYTTDTAEVLPVMRWDKWQPADLDRTDSESLYFSVVRPFERPMGTYEDNFGTKKPVTRRNPTGSVEGAYIAGLFVMDKNTIRQEKLASGIPSDQCTCDKITDQEVFDRLKAMGATTIIETPLCITGEYYEGNTNKVFIGYTRTDNVNKAIKNIVVHTSLFQTSEPAEIITLNRDDYDLVAEGAKKVEKLPRAINLIGRQDAQDIVEPRMYLYTTTEGKGAPIYDICIDSTPLKQGWLTVRAESGSEPFHDLYKQASKMYDLSHNDNKNSSSDDLVYSKSLRGWSSELMSMFSPEKPKATPFYIHCKTHESNALEEVLPYISEIFIAEGGSKNEALAKLLEFEPDGFIDYDFNEGTWFGKHIYMAYKRTADKNEAIKELAVFTGKNPSESKILNFNGVDVRLDLVANVDLNSGAGGDWLYLYATKNGAAGEPIKSLRVSNEVVNRMVGGVFTEHTVRRANESGFTDQDPDLNDGAGGDYIYLVYKRDVVKSEWPAWMFGGALFGDGSLRAVFVLAGIAAVAAVLVYGRKKGKEESEKKAAS